MSELLIRYRPARPVDADQVHSVYAAAAEEEGSLVEEPNEVSVELIRNRIRNSIGRRNQLFLVAGNEAQIIAMASLESPTLHALQHIRFLSLVVMPAYRRKGIARSLLEQTLEWVRESPDVEKIELRIRETNAAGVALCKSFGFEVEGRLKHHILLPNGRYLDDLVLAWFVDAPPPNEK